MSEGSGFNINIKNQLSYIEIAYTEHNVREKPIYNNNMESYIFRNKFSKNDLKLIQGKF